MHHSQRSAKLLAGSSTRCILRWYGWTILDLRHLLWLGGLWGKTAAFTMASIWKIWLERILHNSIFIRTHRTCSNSNSVSSGKRQHIYKAYERWEKEKDPKHKDVYRLHHCSNISSMVLVRHCIGFYCTGKPLQFCSNLGQFVLDGLDD